MFFFLRFFSHCFEILTCVDALFSINYICLSKCFFVFFRKMNIITIKVCYFYKNMHQFLFFSLFDIIIFKRFFKSKMLFSISFNVF